TGARNIISGNAAGYGIEIIASGTAVEGNYIGTDVSGTAALPNLSGMTDSPYPIGSTSFVAGNLISGNTNIGATMSEGCAVQGHLIGTDCTGTQALGNGQIGVFLNGGGTLGGLPDAARNVISGNGQHNVFVNNGVGAVI